jgi:hypothetical protein
VPPAPQPATPSNEKPADEDYTLQHLRDQLADSDRNREELRSVLKEQNAQYTSSRFVNAARIGGILPTRDLAKENITAWMQFEKKQRRLKQKLEYLERERAGAEGRVKPKEPGQEPKEPGQEDVPVAVLKRPGNPQPITDLPDLPYSINTASDDNLRAAFAKITQYLPKNKYLS